MTDIVARIVDDEAFIRALLEFRDYPTFSNRRAVARAAISAMREPTPAMIVVGDRAQTKWDEPVAMEAQVPWRAMIDAALKEP